MAVRFPMNADASVAPVAERLVVEAERMVEVETYSIPIEDDAAEKAVVEAFVA